MGGAVPLLPLYALMACPETFSLLLLHWLQKLTELYANGPRFASDLNAGHLYPCQSCGKYSASFCEHGDGPPNSIKLREFID